MRRLTTRLMKEGPCGLKPRSYRPFIRCLALLLRRVCDEPRGLDAFDATGLVLVTRTAAGAGRAVVRAGGVAAQRCTGLRQELARRGGCQGDDEGSVALRTLPQ